MCLAVPGRILEITDGDELLKTAKVSFGGAVKDINISFVPDAKIGDYVIVHVGFALNIIDEEEAQKTMDYLNQMGDIE
jgi:hydrogenase expression/formation protein HypC